MTYKRAKIADLIDGKFGHDTLHQCTERSGALRNLYRTVAGARAFGRQDHPAAGRSSISCRRRPLGSGSCAANAATTSATGAKTGSCMSACATRRRLWKRSIRAWWRRRSLNEPMLDKALCPRSVIRHADGHSPSCICSQAPGASAPEGLDQQTCSVCPVRGFDPATS
jgi:hypothetical protein